MCIVLYFEALPESFVMVGGSQGLAPLLHVGSGSVYLVLMESRWASYDSPLLYRLTESGPLIPPARQSWVDHLWLDKEEHRWFLIGRHEMVMFHNGKAGYLFKYKVQHGKTVCTGSDRKHWTSLLCGLTLLWWRNVRVPQFHYKGGQSTE